MDLGVSVCVSLFYVINTGSTGSRGPIRTWGLPVYPPPLLTLCQSTPNLIGCPSQHRGRPGSRSPGTKPQDRVVGPPSRTGPHLPVRHNRGSAAIPSSRSRWRIGLKPTRLHLNAHKYMEKIDMFVWLLLISSVWTPKEQGGTNSQFQDPRNPNPHQNPSLPWRVPVGLHRLMDA